MNVDIGLPGPDLDFGAGILDAKAEIDRLRSKIDDDDGPSGRTAANASRFWAPFLAVEYGFSVHSILGSTTVPTLRARGSLTAFGRPVEENPGIRLIENWFARPR